MPDISDSLTDNIFNLLTSLKNADDIGLSITQTIKTAADIANADGYFLFHITSNSFMNLICGNIQSINISFSDLSNSNLFKSVYLPNLKNKNIKSPFEICATNKEIINSANIFNETNINISLLKEFDETNNYTTVSTLCFPIFDSKRNIIAVAQFINAKDLQGKVIKFSSRVQNQIIAICQIISLILERKQISETYTQLLESFIDIFAKAIDAKSPYTGLHCQKVPIIARLLASAVADETEGPLKNFDMSNNDWYSLHIASWLHDCGKIITPEYIMDKSSKLETIYNRIHEIRTRFEVLRRDAHIEYLQKRLQNIDTKENLQAEFVNKVKNLTDDFEFIGQCNIGDVPLSDEDIIRLNKIAKYSFTRNFSRTSGLSWLEKDILEKQSIVPERQEVEYILQDRPEQIASHYNQGELTNIKVPQGTINPKERQKINEHIITTINILKNIPFPAELSNIVEYAGSHHERIDGKGYPYGLTGEQMSIPAKIMAIADVYEALTAKDRPYKKPKKLSEVLKIMQEMKNTGHLDPDLYNVFIKRGVYLDYAKEYIDKNQIDDINPEEFL
ncbi:MAG: HD domain-containing protein [Alphaproteobacteria bacterium]|nr:HD domain-containing protein [Alphaproteobacteria bacterium]